MVVIVVEVVVAVVVGVVVMAVTMMVVVVMVVRVAMDEQMAISEWPAQGCLSLTPSPVAKCQDLPSGDLLGTSAGTASDSTPRIHWEIQSSFAGRVWFMLHIVTIYAKCKQLKDVKSRENMNKMNQHESKWINSLNIKGAKKDSQHVIISCNLL